MAVICSFRCKPLPVSLWRAEEDLAGHQMVFIIQRAEAKRYNRATPDNSSDGVKREQVTVDEKVDKV